MTIQHRTVDIEAASKLWKEDLSASQIAKCFGASQRHRRDHISKSRVLPSRPRARNCRPHESKRAPRKDNCNARPQARYHNHPSPQI